MFKPCSFMFLLVISLLPTTVFAADDILRLQIDDVDESPAGFMARLRKAEAASDIDEKGKFTLPQEFLNEIEMSRSMPEYSKPSYMAGFLDYFEYFRALATSTRLTDEQKLKKEFVLIPYFKNLAYESEVVQDRELDLIEPGYPSGPSCSHLYPYVRLFLSALGHIMHNVNLHNGERNPLCISLNGKDVSLTELLLKCGADPNAELTLKYCKTLKQAQLLVQGGADIGGQLEKSDLISPVLGVISQAIDEGDPDLLIFLLQHVELNIANQFGKDWLYCLATKSSSLELENFSEKLSALLKTGCLYDEERIFNFFNSFWFSLACGGPYRDDEPGKAQKIRSAFTQAFEQEKRRKNIVHGLRERQRTGQSLRALQTNLRPCYERALELHEQQKKK